MALAAPALAQRVALLIGNASYTSAPLTNPANDVRVMEAALREVGFRVTSIVNANQAQMKRAIRDFGERAQGAEIAFVYYSGHGTQAWGENFLIPIGASIAKESDYEIEAVAANGLLRQIVAARPKSAIVVLDACRDNPLASLTRSTGKGLARMDAPVGSMIAFATAPNSTAPDEGLYARVLAAQIRTPGLELYDVFRNTAAEVRRRSNGRQEPRVSEVSITDRIYLAGMAAPPPPPAPSAPMPPAAVAGREPMPAPTPASAPPPAPAAVRPPTAETAPATATAASQRPTPRLAAPVIASPGATVVDGQAFRDCPTCPELVAIPSGRFLMGSPSHEKARNPDESPQREVRLARFAIGRHEVTQGQWKAVMGSNPSRFSTCGDHCPVESVSWNDVQSFIDKLNQRTGCAGTPPMRRQCFRLPSEAEWEYAARAGTTTPHYTGLTITTEQANFDRKASYERSGKRQDALQPLAKVGSYAPNPWGLYDMAGNVWEWVQDCKSRDYQGHPLDGTPREDTGCRFRVVRGGGWLNYAPYWLRSASRYSASPIERSNSIGLRLARSLP